MTQPVIAESTVHTRLTLGILWTGILSGRRVIATVTGIATLACLAVAVFTTSQYSATTILAPSTTPTESGGLSTLAGQLGGLADIAGIDLSGRQNVDQTLVILQSDEFLERFVETEGVMQELFADQWDSANRRWREDHSLAARLGTSLRALSGWLTPDQPGTGTSSPDTWSALRRFKPLISVEKDKRTQIVTLSVRWKDPKVAAAWANTLVRHLNDEARMRAIREANDSLGYLADQLKHTQVLELRDTLFRLVEAEQKQAMIASTRQELALRVLAKAQVPRERISPKRRLLIIGGLVGGLVIGIFLTMARLLLRVSEAGRL